MKCVSLIRIEIVSIKANKSHSLFTSFVSIPVNTKMKLLLLALLVAAASAENYDGPEYAPFDASSIIPVQDMPGFWEGRDFPAAFTNPIGRNRRIVGGTEVVPNSHPYQVALHISFGAGTGLCGGSVLTSRSARE